MKRKLSCLLVGVMLVSSLLTGCGGSLFTPTAEDLLNGAFPEDMVYADYTMSLVMDMDVSAEDMSMNMEISGDFDVESVADVTHMEGGIEAEILGMKVEEELESYQVLEDEELTTYNYDSDSDSWSYTVTDLDAETLLPTVQVDAFSDLAMESTDKGYVVTGKITDFENIPNISTFSDDMEDALEDVEFLATFNFDSNENLTSYKVDVVFDEEVQEDIELTINEFTLEITYNSFDGEADAVKVPKKVTKGAVEESDSDLSLDFGNLGDSDDIDDTIIADDVEPDTTTPDSTDKDVASNDTETEDVKTPDNTEESRVDVVLDSAWTNYEFAINGKQLSLPCSYEDITGATGLTMKSSQAKSYLEGGYYSSVNLYNANEDLGLYVDIMNTTDADVLYTDCDIASIWQSEYQIENGAPVVTFPCGLQVGMEMTKDKLESILGTPYDTYDYEDGDYVSWSYEYNDSDGYSYNSYEISVTNGVIDEISLSHLDY